MDTNKIKELTESLESIKSAKFYHPNWAFIGFESGFTSADRMKVIRTAPLSEHHAALMKELNEAIKPVLDKYEKIFTDAIKREANN